MSRGDWSPARRLRSRSTIPCCRTPPGRWRCSNSSPSGLDRVKVGLAAQYVDHNLLQTDNKNADDHKYLQTACARYGIHFSRPGNGVSHQVHMERFGRPGLTMIGSDSHTPGAAGVSMLAIGAGGLDVAMAMAGHPYYFPCPKGSRRQAYRAAPRLGQRQGRDPGDAASLRRQGVRRQDRRVLRTGGEDPLGHRPRNHRQHGDRTRRHHHGLPLRRAHPRVPGSPGARRRLAGACRGPRLRLRRARRDRPGQRRAADRLPDLAGKHQAGRRGRRHQGRPGHRRLLGQLLLPRPDGGGQESSRGAMPIPTPPSTSIPAVARCWRILPTRAG